MQRLNSPSAYPILCPLVNWILLFFAACGQGLVPDTNDQNPTFGTCIGKSFDISDRNNFEPLTSLNRSLRKNTMSPFKFSAVTVVEFLGGAGQIDWFLHFIKYTKRFFVNL